MTTAGGKPQRGRLIVLAAPSGAGKTTLVHALLERMPGLRFSISYTTRQARKSEVDGRDYFFVGEDEFAAMVRGDEFLEHARVFDHCYGTGRRHVEALLASGETVLLEIDWQGARQVKRAAAEATSIFILPPSVSELERRLRGRGTDSAAIIERRLRDALGDMQHWREFDYAIVNERLDEAAAVLADVVVGHGEANRTDSPALRARIEAILES